MHLVRWEKVTKPTNKGGLGLQKSHVRNIALLTKLNQRFLHDRQKPWVTCLYQKYVFNRDKLKSNVSPTWKAMQKARDFLNLRLRWLPLNGKSIHFWFDNWIGL